MHGDSHGRVVRKKMGREVQLRQVYLAPAARGHAMNAGELECSQANVKHQTGPCKFSL